ncbi:hypothetical protein BDV26DRAFT_102980 [Aspergillus bertholletiae]|uniref:Uncharacterized protein n=1 Tax=Aspergillus bertholletiae TaxID=1226010 RepID=A0A5N7AR55_9EURO|nr:hypothetical protein BDV26DRAFT_102980 [Aspergillus bertholletiae]
MPVLLVTLTGEEIPVSRTNRVTRRPLTQTNPFLRSKWKCVLYLSTTIVYLFPNTGRQASGLSRWTISAHLSSPSFKPLEGPLPGTHELDQISSIAPLQSRSRSNVWLQRQPTFLAGSRPIKVLKASRKLQVLRAIFRIHSEAASREFPNPSCLDVLPDVVSPP